MKLSKKPVSLYLKAFLAALISSLALVVKNGTYVLSAADKAKYGNKILIFAYQVLKGVKSPTFEALFFIILAFIAFVYLIPRFNKKNLKIGIPFAVIVSACILLADSYYRKNSWANVLGSKTALVTSCLKGIGMAVLILFMYDIVCKICIEKGEGIDLKTAKKSFIKFTLIMFACWIPYMIIMAPGEMNGDTQDQFAQILGNREFSWTIKSIIVNPGESFINNHHPVFHTFMLGIFIKLGQLIGSYFIAMEIYCVLQCLAFSAALTFMVVKLMGYGLSKRTAKIIFAFFALFPLFPLWGMATFKDTPFTIALIFTTILLFDAFKQPESFGKRKYVMLFFFLMLLMLLRNNGFYMLLLLLPFVIIHFRKDKKFLLKITSVILAALIVFKVGYAGILFKALDIKDGSPREMLSVPFQQTARYVAQYGDEVTPEEEKAIKTVLGGNKWSLKDIAENYVPDRSDSIKDNFNKYATKEELVEYFKVWLNQLLKHPAVYVEAFLNLNYPWFSYDCHYDGVYYNGITVEPIPKFVDGLENKDGLMGIRALVKVGMKAIEKTPVIGSLLEISFYALAYIVAFIIMLKRKRHKELLATLPIFINFVICFVGPVAYMRYAIPMAACLPFVTFITYSKNKEEKTKAEEKEIWIK